MKDKICRRKRGESFIMKQQREGTITREEAQAQLAELGVEFPGNRNGQ